MTEPWYESCSVTIQDAISAVMNCWFCRQMLMTANGYESNQQLKNHIIILERLEQSNTRWITFESLRYNTPDWEQKLTKIVEEEVEREERKFNGLGSYRGFYTIVFVNICNNVLERVIIEMWALPTINRKLKKYTREYIENRFAPGEIGFLESQEHFMELVCTGCRQGLANQEAHMDIGGCLYLPEPPEPPKLVRENAMNF